MPGVPEPSEPPGGRSTVEQIRPTAQRVLKDLIPFPLVVVQFLPDRDFQPFVPLNTCEKCGTHRAPAWCMAYRSSNQSLLLCDTGSGLPHVVSLYCLLKVSFNLPYFLTGCNRHTRWSGTRTQAATGHARCNRDGIGIRRSRDGRWRSADFLFVQFLFQLFVVLLCTSDLCPRQNTWSARTPVCRRKEDAAGGKTRHHLQG